MTQPPTNFAHIAIVGSGAIGLYYGGRLAQHGHNVTFLMRSDAAAARASGIVVHSIHGDFSLPAPQIAESTAEIGPVDLAIIAWKTTSNHLLASALPPLLHAHTQILTLQNGIGNCEKIAAIAGSHRVSAGLCFIGINRTAPAQIHHSASGHLILAAFAPTTHHRLQQLVALFSSAKITVASEPSLEAAIWKKLLWNIPFNGLAIAEGGKTTKDLLENPHTVERIRRLMHEVSHISLARGYPIDETLIDFHIDRTYKMGAYRPSSMLDWMAGRPVEIEPIWTEPLRIGKELGLELPELQSLHQEIHAACAHAAS